MTAPIPLDEMSEKACPRGPFHICRAIAEVERVFRQHAAGPPTHPAQEPDDAEPDEAIPACVASTARRCAAASMPSTIARRRMY